MKQKIITGIAFLATVALISGATYLAVASPGSESDPFITRSYLNDIFKPQFMNDVKTIEQEMTQKFNTRIAELEAQLASGGGGGSGQTVLGDTEKFRVVTLNRNQTLTCSVGTEIMLRIGTANGQGSVPALVNYTSGSTLSSGNALVTNNMYLVTIEGNGLRATADTVWVLVRGTYKIT